jgi:hypothetical protein
MAPSRAPESQSRACYVASHLILIVEQYRNTTAVLPPGERIFILFEKIRFTSQKLNFLIFVF